MPSRFNLIITAVFPPEPVVSARISYDLADELSKTESVVVLSPAPSRPFGFIFANATINSKFKHIILDSFTAPQSGIIGRIKESYSFGVKSARFIEHNNENIKKIYLNTWPILAQYFVVRKAKKFKIPCIIHVQDIYPEALLSKMPSIGRFLNTIFISIDKYILKNSSKVIAISLQMKEYLVKTRGLKKENVAVVQNWQDETEFVIAHNVKENQQTPKDFVIMYLGNLGPLADIVTLIKAFDKAEIPNAKLIIAGSGSQKEHYQRIALQTRIAESIEFIQVREGYVHITQSASSILVLPMKAGAAKFSVPSKLPAYMFSKRPVLACVEASSSTAQIVNDSGCGWVVDPENVNSLAKKLFEVSKLEDEFLAQNGILGYNYAINNLSKKINLKFLLSNIKNS